MGTGIDCYKLGIEAITDEMWRCELHWDQYEFELNGLLPQHGRQAQLARGVYSFAHNVTWFPDPTQPNPTTCMCRENASLSASWGGSFSVAFKGQLSASRCAYLTLFLSWNPMRVINP